MKRLSHACPGVADAAMAALSGRPAVAECLGMAGDNCYRFDAKYVSLNAIEPHRYLLLRLAMDTAQGR